ncbi:MAG TPA: YraN family protein [Rhizomicrobium sp.]|nr:YraN family protein [Rhizomicrobium sp.]
MTDAEEIRVRKRRERLGRRSEMFATWLLRLKGYRILGRRVRTPLGEIDVIARAPSGMLCFVEVKMRSAAETALLALGPQQQMRIARAAELYLAHRPDLGRKGVRFDVVTVGARTWPRHLADAWRPDWR